MDATELLNDIRRLKSSLNNKRIRRRNESRSDYIKRKAKYKCCYCHRHLDKKKLTTSLEPFHIVKNKETVNDILTYYRTSKEQLLNLNPKLSLEDIQTGTLLRVPEFFKIFPNTHGICYCDKCSNYRNTLNMDHVSFIFHLIQKRRNVRDEITPELRRKIYARDNYKCVYCQIEYGETKPNTFLTLDHKNPIVSGGDNSEENLCTSCNFHNFEKGEMKFNYYINRIKNRRFKRENLCI
ncbi:endonuclease domain-containing protein [Bacillus mexicanus]|uniref:endonuclease domain-containing protein n=1 Tax=Bacillus mexicanus TaxID=2834415 RepID=UPI003D1D64CD